MKTIKIGDKVFNVVYATSNGFPVMNSGPVLNVKIQTTDNIDNIIKFLDTKSNIAKIEVDETTENGSTVTQIYTNFASTTGNYQIETMGDHKEISFTFREENLEDKLVQTQQVINMLLSN